MDLDLKLVSKEINEMMWRNHKTLATAESCTAGRVASVITARLTNNLSLFGT